MSESEYKKYEKVDIHFTCFCDRGEHRLCVTEVFMKYLLDNREICSNQYVKIKLGRAFEKDSDYIDTNIDEYCSFIDTANEKKLVLFLGMGTTSADYFSITGVDFEGSMVPCKFPYDCLQTILEGEEESSAEEAHSLTQYVLKGVCRKFKNTPNFIHGFIYFKNNYDDEKNKRYASRIPEFIEKITKKYIIGY